MKVQEIDLEKVIVGERFRKEEGDLDELAASIKSKGLLQPITLDKNLNLVAGERRLRAARRLKFEKIPAIVRDISGEIDAREIELFENIHRKQMTWQEEVKLTAKIHDLKQSDAKANGKPWKQNDTAKLIGKSEALLSQKVQLAKAMEAIPGLEDCSSEKEARKKVKKILEKAVVDKALSTEKSKTHKFIKWAERHYHIGDAFEGMGKMHTGVMDFAEVDPPYAIDLKEKKSKGSSGIDEYNEIDPKDYPDFLLRSAKEVYRVLAPDRFAVWWFGIEWYSEVYHALKEAGFSVDPIPAIWYKSESGGATGSPQTNLARTYEPFFVCRKGVPELRERGRSNVFAFKPVSSGSKAHPTERPVTLIRAILDTFVYPGAVVMSPFLGSGNTIIAAYASGCNAFGWDLSESYKDSFLSKVNSMFEQELLQAQEEPSE